ncbi:MAG: alpha/beta hydrolase [Sphaerochaetaceae bacterium]|nr:alpha/beta hydrolase [Sphaerochaetaceae bacterium]
MKNKPMIIALIVVLAVFALSLLLIIGTSTSWGKVEVTDLALATGDGDKIHVLLYKPKEANKDNPVPLAIIAHGGSDMLEQASGYAIELSRRGYAVLTYDYQGQAGSDVATGTAEGNSGRSGYGKRGLNTIWNAVHEFNFVDWDHVITMGHSGGGMHTNGFATDHQDEIFMQVNLGMNMYGPATIEDHNYNFVNILGDSDESALARAVGDTNWSHFQVEQLKRIFFNEYTKKADDSYAVAKENLPELILNKVYTVTGSDGKQYTRTAYMPDSCHAYYLVDNDAVRTVIYGITSQVGLGLDAGVKSYDDYEKISLVYRLHDLGYALELLAMIGLMGIVAIALTKTSFFKSMELKPTKNVGFKKMSPLWWVALALIVILPPALYTTGKLPQDTFLGIKVSGLWLLDGNCSAWLCWQWLLSIVYIALFLVYHFFYGKKNGGDFRSYGFATSDTKAFDITYILKALLYGVIVIGSGYLLMAFASHYTQQGLHIATFMLRTLDANRTAIFLVYFLMSVPYFLSSSLMAKTLGINGDGTTRTAFKNVGIMSAIALAGLFILWVVFVVCLSRFNYILPMFKVNRLYILGVGIIPILIGIGVGNAINVFITQKTNSIWPGLFSAVLWGTWTITACTAVLKYFY